MMTIQKISSILKRASLELNAAGCKSAGLDARVLLEKAISKSTAYLFAHPEMPMSNPDYTRFRRYIRRRKTGEPVAYILGHKEFFGLDFIVNKNVLIPRPETEWLVKEAADCIRYCVSGIKEEKEQKDKTIIHNTSPAIRVLDIGTGSGCIIVSLIKSLQKESIYTDVRPHHNVDKFYATDISKKALMVTKKNAKKHQVYNLIRFYHSDLFSNPRLPNKFDLVIANLPYVPKKAKSRKLKVESVNFEPQTAIYADDNGTDIIKRFLNEAKKHLNPLGMILLELDPRNAHAINKYATKMYPNSKIELKKDLANLDRYLTIQPNS